MILREDTHLETTLSFLWELKELELTFLKSIEQTLQVQLCQSWNYIPQVMQHHSETCIQIYIPQKEAWTVFTAVIFKIFSDFLSTVFLSYSYYLCLNMVLLQTQNGFIQKKLLKVQHIDCVFFELRGRFA